MEKVETSVLIVKVMASSLKKSKVVLHDVRNPKNSSLAIDKTQIYD
ncbi:hypothetical protein HMPREF0322_01257 [Desulfitobacterium hafniense DP7]|uniref:Uncharacterized protein n=1 Tax=Desulfitobacterium hafniense DP7 TaxID=537010 RepID=G9XJX6_DESHA|nr:hypothetical protein HMPREF0322_01257 [Desulfitobacterium hafniense DP7]